MKRFPLESLPAIPSPAPARGRPKAFSFIELLISLSTLMLLAAVMVPALARARPVSKTFQCQNNLRQLYLAWRQWADDNADWLVTAWPGPTPPRPNWVQGVMDFDGSNRSNFDTNQDLAKSPLWTYVAKNPTLFTCPADPSTVSLAASWNGLPAGTTVPRVRSMSMNSAFGQGAWLDGTFNQAQTVWRTYGKIADIVIPARTFLFADEHGDTINDDVLNTACTGADSPSTAKLIDFPASYHNGAANFSFTDGHALCHQLIGSAIRPPFQKGGFVAQNVPAGDSWMDAEWLAQNTTVKR